MIPTRSFLLGWLLDTLLVGGVALVIFGATLFVAGSIIGVRL